MITNPSRSGCAQSWYEATRADDAGHPSLGGDVAADVVVLGAGYTGLSAALHLAQAGRRVVLLEQARVGWGASGRNGGIVIPGFRRDAAYLLRVFGREDALRLWAMAMEALALQRRLIEVNAIDCAYTRAGWVHAAVTRAAAREAAAEVALLRDVFGHQSATTLDRDDVQALVRSERYVGGMVDTLGGHLHPLNYALGLAAAAAAAGATLYEGTRATGVTTVARGVRVQTSRGSVTATHCVIATDALAAEIDPAFSSTMMGVENFLVATEPLGERLDAILPSRAAVSDTKFVLDYFRPTQDGRLVFGGGEKWTPGLPPDIAAFVRPYLERAFPPLRGVRIDYAWSGTVSVTMTRNPAIGRRGPVWYALGYSGQGVVTAGYAGAVLARAIAGDDPDFGLMSRFPGAPFPGGKLARSPLYVAGMAYYALRDRLGLALEGKI